MIAGGDVPDVMMVDAYWFPAFIQQKMLRPLDDYLQKDTKYSGFKVIKGFWPLPDHHSADGKVYSKVHSGDTPRIIYFNDNMFKEAGIPNPIDQDKAGKWDWNAYLDAAKKLTRGSGQDKVFGAAAYPLSSAMYSFIATNGGKVFSDDKKKCLISSPETLEAIQFQMDMIRTHKVSPLPEESQVLGGDLKAFMARRLGMFISGIWTGADTRNVKDFEWAIAPLPKSPKTGYRRTLYKPNSTSVPAVSKNADASWRWMSFDPLGQNRLDDRPVHRHGDVRGQQAVLPREEPGQERAGRLRRLRRQRDDAAADHAQVARDREGDQRQPAARAQRGEAARGRSQDDRAGRQRAAGLTRWERRAAVASITDVARMAGVSITTASRVLNPVAGYPIAPTTRQRVLAAAETLQYSPSLIARALVTRRSRIVGAIVGDIVDPYFAEIVRGVEDVARRAGYMVVVCNTDRDPATERRYLAALRDYRADAVLFLGGDFNDPSGRRELEQELALARRNGTVALALAGDRAGLPTVDVDHRAGARQMTEYLIGLGHRRIGFMAGPIAVSTARQRLDGFRDAMQAAGLDAGAVVEGGFNYAGGVEGAERLLPRQADRDLRRQRRDGDRRLTAARMAGLTVPVDLSVVGFGDTARARQVVPALTTVFMPRHEIGAAAMEMVLAALGPAKRPASSLIVAHHLVTRGSAARPRADQRPRGCAPPHPLVGRSRALRPQSSNQSHRRSARCRSD